MDALREEEERLKIKSDHTDIFFSYLQRSRYIEHLQRFEKLFGKGQLKVILFEDLISDPNAVLDDLMGFLGLPVSAGVEKLPHLNEMAGLHESHSDNTGGLLGKMLSVFSKDSSRKKKLSRTERAYLQAYFSGYNQQLEVWLDRSLPWTCD